MATELVCGPVGRWEVRKQHENTYVLVQIHMESRKKPWEKNVESRGRKPSHSITTKYNKFGLWWTVLLQQLIWQCLAQHLFVGKKTQGVLDLLRDFK